MKKTIHCPACLRDFSCLRQVNKLYILYATCPHCRSTLTVKNVGILVSVTMIACALLAVLYVQRQVSLGYQVNFLIPILLVLIYEVIAAFIIANKGTMVIRRNRYSEKKTATDDNDDNNDETV